MLEEAFTGDERHDVVPTNFMRHGLLNKKQRVSSLALFGYSSWKIRRFNLTANQTLEFWLNEASAEPVLKGAVCVKGAVTERLEIISAECDNKPYSFKITLSPDVPNEDNRPLILSALSQSDCDAWISSLQLAAVSAEGILEGLHWKSLGSGSSPTRVRDLTPDEE